VPETIDDKRVFSLLEIGQSIQRMFDTHYVKRYWVKAEMHKLNLYGRSGHCFPDLVEKKDGRVIAEMRANLWKSDFQRVNKEFIRVLGEPLKEGIKILFCTTVKYHPRYGLTLHIVDIDVDYTLGDLAKERKETMLRLKSEGLLDANKLLPTPVLPKRIAVISVETSNGYADFVKVLETNEHGYQIQHTLFPSLLQGDRAVGAMVRQLKLIAQRKDEFDLVAIIRGGGGDIGLSFLNKYEIAKAVASFPLPVVTGIGHATNQTVVEMIAHKDAITPTEMAEWLIQRFRLLDDALDSAVRSLQLIPKEILFGAMSNLTNTYRFLRTESRRILEGHRSYLGRLDHGLIASSQHHVKSARHTIDESVDRLGRAMSFQSTTNQNKLEGAQKRLLGGAERLILRKGEALKTRQRSVTLLDPKQVLKRGYSISRYEGRAVRNADVLEKGAILTTEFYQGTAISKLVDKATGEDE